MARLEPRPATHGYEARRLGRRTVRRSASRHLMRVAPVAKFLDEPRPHGKPAELGPGRRRRRGLVEQQDFGEVIAKA